jgi:hypothetical protein
VGISVAFVPRAPGAPSGQSGIGACISAWDKIKDIKKMTAVDISFI